MRKQAKNEVGKVYIVEEVAWGSGWRGVDSLHLPSRTSPANKQLWKAFQSPR
jgi:hypothetical protein